MVDNNQRDWRSLASQIKDPPSRRDMLKYFSKIMGLTIGIPAAILYSVNWGYGTGRADQATRTDPISQIETIEKFTWDLERITYELQPADNNCKISVQRGKSPEKVFFDNGCDFEVDKIKIGTYTFDRPQEGSKFAKQDKEYREYFEKVLK